MASYDDLPLRTRTPRAWAEAALADPIALLDDHAHLERKAASNAIALLASPPRSGAAAWARVLAGVARDETEHLALVLRRLEAAGGSLSRGHRNPYAAALHGLARIGGPGGLVDRLLVCALIEARSCERFERLAEAGADPALRALHASLATSERGHHRAFVALAREVARGEDVDARLAWFLDREAEAIAAQAPGPRIHSSP